jgi:predicted kinase
VIDDVLVVVGGLPAAGKTTIAAALARRVGTAFLRVDSIQEAILRATSLAQLIGPVGYVVGYALAEDQLRNGLSVVADLLNPLALTRQAWRETGLSQGARVVEVEVICSDPVDHRRRAESRTVDITDLRLPTGRRSSYGRTTPGTGPTSCWTRPSCPCRTASTPYVELQASDQGRTNARQPGPPFADLGSRDWAIPRRVGTDPLRATHRRAC